MAKRIFLLAALALAALAAFILFHSEGNCVGCAAGKGFVTAWGTHFLIDGRPFRFVGANVPGIIEPLPEAAQSGIKVVRLWAFGEGEYRDPARIPEPPGQPPRYPFRRTPNNWNEEALRQLDRLIAEAGHNGLRVQICLTNWWRDTGGVTQYLRWAGIQGADDDRYPYGINPERAMLFYTNEETRRLYREHMEKLATRRNTITGVYYRDDPTIFGWELMNEAQAVTGRWGERRAWIAEMSAHLKSLDPNHLIAPGDWGYRSAAERREWIVDHRLANVDYCDVHIYPIDDHDTFVDSLADLREFIANRAAAAFAVNKPLVFGEFGIVAGGYKGFSQKEWFRTFFEANARAGAAGAMFWILTTDAKRRYSVTFTTRDETLLQEIIRAAWLFDNFRFAEPPASLTDPRRHLVPRQFVFTRAPEDVSLAPQQIFGADKSILYRFKPQMAVRGQFEKLGDGPDYIWGSGVGYFDYLVPRRQDRRRVGRVIVRAHIQPVVPTDAHPEHVKTRVTLFVNDLDCGSRLIPVENPKQPSIQEWSVDDFWVRLSTMLGKPVRIRFAVTPESDWLYGVNIATWPKGYEAGDSAPVEVLVTH